MKILKRLSEKKSCLSASAPATIAFLGDSITQGCFELCEGHNCIFDTIYDDEAVYHSRLKGMLHSIFPTVPINIINAGIEGNNAQQGCSRIERDVFAYSPDLLVVCFGLNDACGGMERLDRYAEGLEAIFKKCREKGLETIFMTPNMFNTYVSPLTSPHGILNKAQQTAEIQNSGVMDAYMSAARKLCMRESIPVCDCYKKWITLYEAGVDTTKLLSNYINHPIREMHKLFAASLMEMILFS